MMRSSLKLNPIFKFSGQVMRSYDPTVTACVWLQSGGVSSYQRAICSVHLPQSHTLMDQFERESASSCPAALRPDSERSLKHSLQFIA